MKKFALKSRRFCSGFVGSLVVFSVFVLVCHLGLANLCNAESSKSDNGKFDAIESKIYHCKK